MKEKKVPIPGYEGYLITRSGKVFTVNGRLLKPQLNHGKRLYVYIQVGNKRYLKSLHRLLALTFIPNPDNLPLVRHLDDNPLNNELSNLAWGTPKDNTRDCINNGNFVYPKYAKELPNMRGKNHPRTVLSLTKIKKIVSLSDKGIPRKQIASILGLKYRVVNRVFRNLDYYLNNY